MREVGMQVQAAQATGAPAEMMEKIPMGVPCGARCGAQCRLCGWSSCRQRRPDSCTAAAAAAARGARWRAACRCPCTCSRPPAAPCCLRAGSTALCAMAIHRVPHLMWVGILKQLQDSVVRASAQTAHWSPSERPDPSCSCRIHAHTLVGHCLVDGFWLKGVLHVRVVVGRLRSERQWLEWSGRRHEMPLWQLPLLVEVLHTHVCGKRQSLPCCRFS